jgi:hypothetical protein
MADRAEHLVLLALVEGAVETLMVLQIRVAVQEEGRFPHLAILVVLE